MRELEPLTPCVQSSGLLPPGGPRSFLGRLPLEPLSPLLGDRGAQPGCTFGYPSLLAAPKRQTEAPV